MRAGWFLLINLVSMKILQTKSFERAVKKLHSNQKKQLDLAIKTIFENYQIGEQKKGDLSEYRVYKFKMLNQLTLLAYKVEGKNIILAAIGAHENFYRDLKT